MSLRFPYRPDPSRPLDQRLVPPGQLPVRYRPLLNCLIHAPAGGRAVNVSALLDTGADWTVVRQSVVAPLRLKDRVGSTQAIWRGTPIQVEFMRVELEISQGPEIWRWPAILGVTAAKLMFPCLLGHTGFLEFMDATFLGQQRQVVLETNVLFDQIGGIKT